MSAEVLPVITLPSASSMAMAGSPVRSATARAAGTVRLSSGVRSRDCIKTSILCSCAGAASPFFTAQAVAK